MQRLLRLARIISVSIRFGLDEFFLAHARTRFLLVAGQRLLFWRDLSEPRAVRLRLALEALGPLFVKFGQVLSTRRDLLPPDLADELARLQDKVPPFSTALAHAQLERSFGRPVSEVFEQFEPQPVASASIAQVHFAVLPGGRECAVKILRPNMQQAIEKDVALLDSAASLMEFLWVDGRRLKPREVVAEFAKHLNDELDLVREASNASQLRRNFAGTGLLVIPEIYWDYCSSSVMVMQRISGIPISHVDEMRAVGVDIPRIARAGVEIFFTQVFRDGFFHADMHPGNIFVATDVDPRGQFVAVDFGIMGTLTDVDKNYLAQNFLAFFQRDYKRVAQAHLEAGWVPPNTRIDEFENAIRAVCEPVFDRPLKDISFGRVLLRLFQTSRRFNVEIQPQLVLLQKTLLNIEGLGRQMDPELDLWKTAKPYLERWMSEQLGWRGMVRGLMSEAPRWATMLPQLPRLAHRALYADHGAGIERALERLAIDQKKRHHSIVTLCLMLAALLAWQIYLSV